VTVEGGLDSEWLHRTQAGNAVELEVYGEKLQARVAAVGPDNVLVRADDAEQSQALRMSTAYGVALVSLSGGSGGAVRVPVSIRASGRDLQLQVVGAAEVVQRREHRRLNVSLPLVIGWKRGSGNAYTRVVARTVDISLGGLQVAPVTVVWPPLGTELMLSIGFDDEAVEHVTAETIGMTADYGLRTRFLVLPDTAAKRIRGLSE
jgi:hypothetical protein